MAQAVAGRKRFARPTRKQSAGTTRRAPESLVLGLADPGMTPLLRAGLGGLAASLRAILLSRDPTAAWPGVVSIGPGCATAEARRIVVSPGQKGDWEGTLKALFERSFRIRDGIIDLPGTYEHGSTRGLALRCALQDALRRTFLQHGKSALKKGSARLRNEMIDDVPGRVVVQRYASFAHQDAWRKQGLASALPRGRAVKLAGWAYPGAVERHIGFSGRTKFEYTPAQALCACFALVGCLSYSLPRGGAIVISEPGDLVAFAEVRPQLSPRTVADAHVTGAADAVLSAYLALRLDELQRGQPGVSAAHGVTLKILPWARQQKTRASVLSPGAISNDTLDRFDTATRTLPALIRVGRGDGGGDDQEPRAYWAERSEFRRFVSENLAVEEPWHSGFATARTGDSPPRSIHRYRSRADDRGALRPREREGIIAMLEHLEEAERVLVESVHTALRQRFGAIAEQARGNRAAMRNRFETERERWRLAFAGAKTVDQVRHALADLWSRAGPNAELQKSWRTVVPLLGADHWMRARDLALVALASYRGRDAEAAGAAEHEIETAETSEGGN